MSKGKVTIWIVVLIVLFSILMIVESARPKEHSWEDSFSRYDRIPFGSYLLYENMDRLFPEQQVITANNSLNDNLANGQLHAHNYIIIADTLAMDTADAEVLLQSVAVGNDAFIAATSFEGYLGDWFDIETEFTWSFPDFEGLDSAIVMDSLSDSTISINFGEILLGGVEVIPDTAYSLFVNEKVEADTFKFTQWMEKVHLFDFKEKDATILGTDLNGNPNLVRFKHGNGHVIISTLPRAFTNYFIAYPHTHQYAFTALSYLPVRDTYWDEYYKEGRVDIDVGQSGSPLRFILSNPELKYGLWVLIATAFLIMIFHAKRKQRIIPVIKPLENTTLKFVDVISRLYYSSRNHKNISDKKITYFLEFIRTNFQVTTQVFDDEFIDRITVRSGVDREHVHYLFNYIYYLQGLDIVREGQLLELNKKMEEFITNSKR